jgi:leucyl/phenylalanyl-tRNA--protein transferase
MVQAYKNLHAVGLAHSVETWIDGKLCGGLYCVSLGRAVFGESMFSLVPNGSKIALAGLVALCKAHHISMIDCQQNTSHLASMGAGEVTRADFLSHIETAQTLAPVHWDFDPLYWSELLN